MSFIQKVMPPAKESFQNYRVSSHQSNPKKTFFFRLQKFGPTEKAILIQTFLFHKAS